MFRRAFRHSLYISFTAEDMLKEQTSRFLRDDLVATTHDDFTRIFTRGPWVRARRFFSRRRRRRRRLLFDAFPLT